MVTAEFGPEAKGRTATVHRRRPGARTVNDNVGRIRRMFRWAVAEELPPPAVYQALAAVDGPRDGSSARETEPVVQLHEHCERCCPMYPDRV
jgi:hypothetical protein